METSPPNSGPWGWRRRAHESDLLLSSREESIHRQQLRQQQNQALLQQRSFRFDPSNLFLLEDEIDRKFGGDNESCGYDYDNSTFSSHEEWNDIANLSSSSTGHGGAQQGCRRQQSFGTSSSPSTATTKKKDVVDFSQLNFKSLGMYGRQSELSTLEAVLYRMVGDNRYRDEDNGTNDDETDPNKNNDDSPSTTNMNPQTPAGPVSGLVSVQQRQFVLISGESGTGKSYFASSMGSLVKNQFGGRLVMGKFDQFFNHDRFHHASIVDQSQYDSDVEKNFRKFVGDDHGPQEQQQEQQQHRPFSAFTMIFDSLIQEILAIKTSNKSGFDNVLRLRQTVLSQLNDGSANSDDNRNDRKETYVNNESSELMDLIKVFPSLAIIFSPRNDFRNNKPAQINPIFGNVNEQSRHRFGYSVRLLMRILSAFLYPLVIVLDDLQWADMASLELIENLLSDRDNKNLMIIGVYRCPHNRQGNESSNLFKAIENVRRTAVDNDLTITEMKIGVLEVSAVVEMFRGLFSMSESIHEYDEQRILSLAEICHRRTGGNPFYLIHFIAMLYDMCHLEYNVEVRAWQWDLKKIEQCTEATENVVDVLKDQMKRLSPECQQMLKFAALLGSNFGSRAIQALWSNVQETKFCEAKEGLFLRMDGKQDLFQTSLTSCIEGGFISHDGDGMFYWVHDKLQEAAIDLIQFHHQYAYRRYVAEVLSSVLTEKELEDVIFVVVNHFNEVRQPSEDRGNRIKIAHLNLWAANRAVSFSAYESASVYCQHGIDMLPADCWENSYKLSLDLYSLGAETEGFLGNLGLMARYSNEVLRQQEDEDDGKTSTPQQGGVRDKFRVYNVMMNSIQNRNRSSEAADLCLDVLGKYGTKFPTSTASITVRTVYNILRIKMTLKSRTREEVENLPTLNDPALVEQMGLADKLATYLYFVESPLLLLAVFKCVRWTLEHGICRFSPPAFGFTSLLLSGILGDLNGGAIYANYALMLLARLDPSAAKAVEARTTLLTYASVLHWTRPLGTVDDALIRGYHVGMQSGDVESAMYCIYAHITAGFIRGTHLSQIERECRKYVLQMKEHKTSVSMNNCKMTWQMVLNLMGHSQHRCELTGEALNEEEFRKKGEKVKYISVNLNMHKTLIFSIFGNHESGAELALRIGNSFQKTSPGPPMVSLETFHRCLSLLDAARKRKDKRKTAFGEGRGMERKCIKAAKKALATIKNWTDQGNPNVRHYESLLDAELAAYEGHLDVAKKYFETAISLAHEMGFVGDCALINERYGEFLLHLEYGTDHNTREDIVLNDDGEEHVDIDNSRLVTSRTTKNDNLQDAAKRFRNAATIYREWGAFAKADSLESECSDLWRLAFPSHIEVHQPVL